MNTLLNITNVSIENQKILEENLESFIREMSKFFDEEKIEEIARQTGFVERKSKLTGMLFLSLFVFGTIKYGNPSLEDLLGLLNTYIKDFSLSRSGLHQRLNTQAVIFFERILNLAVEHIIPPYLKQNLSSQFRSVLIWDSTYFQLPPQLAVLFPGSGGNASPASVKIQLCYDMCQHHWLFNLQSAAESDVFTMKDKIVEFAHPGDLVLQDLGYFDIGAMANLNDKGAYYLSRTRPVCNIYQYDSMGNLRCEKLMSLIQSSVFDSILDLNVYMQTSNQTLTPVRLIIERLPESVANQRLRKLHKDAQKHGRQVSKYSSFMAQFNCYITNIPDELLCAKNCRFVYALRWQIELIFKAWKSNLHLDEIQVHNRPERVLITILGRLIFIVLSSKIIRVTTSYLWQISQYEISYYRAIRHFQSIAESWFALSISQNFNAIFSLLRSKVIFIQKHSYKLRQHDRILPSDWLQLIAQHDI